ncbi:MAG: hypothetical protein GEU73_08745 [Chloroflexi bacterium]|nr:hypothetical protein [Chloroflexota bacterium]
MLMVRGRNLASCALIATLFMLIVACGMRPGPPSFAQTNGATPSATLPSETPPSVSPIPPTTSVSPASEDHVVVGAGAYPSIGAAVAAAPAGATVRIRAGTYGEPVALTKRLTLEPYGDGPVWIDAGCVNENAVYVGEGAASGSVVRGLGMKRSVDAAVLIQNDTVRDVTIDGNTIQDFDCRNQGPEYRAGVGVWYAGSGQRILNNTITRRIELPGGLTAGKSNCIWFKSSSDIPSGGGHYVAFNTIQGCYDGIGGEVEDDPRGGFDRDTTIERNTIRDCYDDGISAEGGTANVRVRDNLIERCAIGIANAPNLTGPIYFENNTILDGRPGAYGNVLCFKVGNAGSGVAYYTNNRCVLTGDGWAQTNRGNNPIVARGNQINVTRYVIELTTSVAEGTTFDGNCLYTSDPGRFVTWGGVTYTTLDAFRSGAGQETSGSSSPSCGR